MRLLIRKRQTLFLQNCLRRTCSAGDHHRSIIRKLLNGFKVFGVKHFVFKKREESRFLNLRSADSGHLCLIFSLNLHRSSVQNKEKPLTGTIQFFSELCIPLKRGVSLLFEVNVWLSSWEVHTELCPDPLIEA